MVLILSSILMGPPVSPFFLSRWKNVALFLAFEIFWTSLKVPNHLDALGVPHCDVAEFHLPSVDARPTPYATRPVQVQRVWVQTVALVNGHHVSVRPV